MLFSKVFILTFTDKKWENTDRMMVYVDESAPSLLSDEYTDECAWDVAGNYIDSNTAPYCLGEILTLTSSYLKTKLLLNDDEEWYRIDEYRITSEPYHNFRPEDDGGGSSGGGSTSYEKTDVSFYDYDANYTSLKVTYKLWNSSEAKVSSAKIYYGTNSNPSTSKTATVSSALITATITGLKRGTTYYVKCVATGKGGTTTTETTRCMLYIRDILLDSVSIFTIPNNRDSFVCKSQSYF